MVINEIELELRDALARLYDPGFQPSSKLCALLDCENEERAVSIQCKITEGIELLKPSEEVPPSARLFRFYDLLKNRFVLRLTLEETALRMHMSMSSTWRNKELRFTRCRWSYGGKNRQSCRQSRGKAARSVAGMVRTGPARACFTAQHRARCSRGGRRIGAAGRRVGERAV